MVNRDNDKGLGDWLDNPVLTHTFLLVGNVLVESTQQRFVLAAETLIGILCKQSVASAERRTISAVTKASRSDKC